MRANQRRSLYWAASVILALLCLLSSVASAILRSGT
jgi:hypothetical protein